MFPFHDKNFNRQTLLFSPYVSSPSHVSFLETPRVILHLHITSSSVTKKRKVSLCHFGLFSSSRQSASPAHPISQRISRKEGRKLAPTQREVERKMGRKGRKGTENQKKDAIPEIFLGCLPTIGLFERKWGTFSPLIQEYNYKLLWRSEILFQGWLSLSLRVSLFLRRYCFRFFAFFFDLLAFLFNAKSSLPIFVTELVLIFFSSLVNVAEFPDPYLYHIIEVQIILTIIVKDYSKGNSKIILTVNSLYHYLSIS